MTEKFKLTVSDIVDISNGLTDLVQVYLNLKQPLKAYDVSRVVRQLKPEVDVYIINARALANQYGETDRQGNIIVKADVEGFEDYLQMVREIGAKEIPLNIEKITITPEEANMLRAPTLISIVPIVEIVEEKAEAE